MILRMAPAPDFTDSSAWTVTRDVAVFDEHQDRSKDGKLVRKFTRKDLVAIAENCNRREAKGQLCPLSIGHTQDDAPETQQPELVGYARNFRVKYDEALGRYTIRADYYLKADKAKEAATYPRTSVEYWPDDKVFDPIALIRRTPRRDLGQWTYGRPLARKHSKLRPVRYAMGETDMAEEREDERDGKPGDPTQEPSDKDDVDRDDDSEGDQEVEGPEGVDPEMHAKVMKCVRHGYPRLDEIHKGYAEKYAEGEPGDDEITSVPGENNGLPGKKKKNSDDEDEDTDLGAERMSKSNGTRAADDPLHYRRIEVENTKLRKENEKLIRENRHADRLATLEKFARSGVILDIPTEFDDWKDAEETAWKRQCSRYAKNYEKDPTGGMDIQLPRGDNPTEFGEEPTQAQADTALKYMRSNGLTGPNAFKEALAAVRGRKGR